MSPTFLLATALACIQHAAPGPSPAELAASPAPLVTVPADETTEDSLLQITAYVRAGSAHDPVGAEGLAWLTARMVRAGGTAALSPAEVDAELEAMGAIIGVGVDRELVYFSGSVPAENAAAFAALFSELITAPALDPDALAGLRDKAATTLNGMSPDTLAAEAMSTWLNQGHPYGHPVVGRTSAWETLDAGDAEAFYATRYTRDTVTVGLSGPANAQLEASGALSKALETLPEQPYDAYLAIRAKPPAERELLAIDGGSEGAALLLGATIHLPVGHPDRIALELACIALSAAEPDEGGPSLSAVMDFRLQTAITLSSSRLLEDDSPYTTAIVLERTLQQLESWPGVDSESLKSARRLYIDAVDGSAKRLDGALAAEALGLPDTTAILSTAAGLTVDDVNRAFSRYVDPNRLRAVAVVPDPQRFITALFEENDGQPVHSVSISPDRVHIASSEGVFR